MGSYRWNVGRIDPSVVRTNHIPMTLGWMGNPSYNPNACTLNTYGKRDLPGFFFTALERDGYFQACSHGAGMSAEESKAVTWAAIQPAQTDWFGC